MLQTDLESTTAALPAGDGALRAGADDAGWDDPVAATSRRLVWVCAVAIAATGVMVLAGWTLNAEALMTVLPGHIRFKPNTAIGFIAAAVGLIGALGRGGAGRTTRRAAAIFVLALGSASLIEYVARVDLHIDQALFADPVQRTYPGRMAGITAVNFCLAGTSLLLIGEGRRGARAAQGCAVIVVMTSFAAIVGYLYGVPVLYGSQGYTSMALHAGISFLVLATGLLLAPAEGALASLLGARERGGWLSRRLLPAVLLLPSLLGWLYLRPAISFRSPTFAMALFAVTLTVAGTATLSVLANFFNREERQLAELARLREGTAMIVRQSEHELRLITDHLPTLLSYIDPHGRFVRVNRTYEMWMGVASETIVGRTVRELLGETYWRSTQPARLRAGQGLTSTFDAVYPTQRGERAVQVTYAPDMGLDGELEGISCLVQDVHDRRLAEAALRQSEKLAAVGRLASSISHEINNPLEAVTNLLYLAETEPAASPAVTAYVAQAQVELARVTHIVTQTLRFHRQSTGPVPCRLADLLDQVLVLYTGRLTQGKVRVERRDRAERELVCRDGEVRQVLANLVGNAADAMKDGGRLLLRTARLARGEQEGVRVTIADTGHGIAEATRRTLFEPFHTTKGATGSGLGLWISRDIVLRHGGAIRLRSSTCPGRSGTVFQVEWWPVAVEERR